MIPLYKNGSSLSAAFQRMSLGLASQPSPSARMVDHDEKAVRRDFARMSLGSPRDDQPAFNEKAVSTRGRTSSLEARTSRGLIKAIFHGQRGTKNILSVIFDCLLPAFSLTSHEQQTFKGKVKDFINCCHVTKYLSQYGKAYLVATKNLPCNIDQFLKYVPNPTLSFTPQETMLRGLVQRHVQVLDLRGVPSALIDSPEWGRLPEVLRVFSNVHKVHMFPCEFDAQLGKKISCFPVRFFDLMLCSKKTLEGLKEFPKLNSITNNSLLVYDTVELTLNDLIQNTPSPPKITDYELRLFINGATFNEKGIEELCTYCPHIERLELGFPQSINIECFSQFRKLTSLRHLVLHDVTEKQVIALLPFLSKLETLCFSPGSQRPIQGIFEHIGSLFNLKKLHFPYPVSEKDIMCLKTLEELHTLEIGIKGGEASRAFTLLSEMESLRKLKLSLQEIGLVSKVEIARLGNLRNLSVLNIDFGSFEKPLIGLKQRLPHCRILHNDEDIQPLKQNQYETAAECVLDFMKDEAERSSSREYYVRLLERNDSLVSDILCYVNANFDVLPLELRHILRSIGRSISAIELTQLVLSHSNLAAISRYFPELRTLRLDKVTLNSSALNAISRLKELTTLEFSTCDGIAQKALEEVAKRLSKKAFASIQQSAHIDTGLAPKPVGAVIHRRMNSLDTVSQVLATHSNLSTVLRCAHFATKLRRLASSSHDFRSGILKFERINLAPGGLKGVPHVETLKTLEFLDCSGINDALVQEIAESCPELEVLIIPRASITDKALEHINAGCKKLRRLDVSHTQITDSGLTVIALDLYQTLTEINVSSCPKLSREHVARLQRVRTTIHGSLKIIT